MSDPIQARDESSVSDQQMPLDQVWQTFGDQLRRRARTRLRQYGLTGQAESMDICNEVMVDLARREETERLSVDDVLGYILRAIDNEVMDTFRTLARRCRDFRRNDPTPVEEVRMQDAQASPSQLVLRREVADRVRELLGEQDAIAVDLMLANYDWSEIGKRLKIKPDAARMRVRRALEQVRRQLSLDDSEQ